VNWNGSNDTVECIKSLTKIEYANYNIIIVDNGSSNNEVALLHEKVGNYCRIIELKRNLGFAIANNIGIRIALQSGAEYILLLNNDTVVDSRFLSELIVAACNDPKRGILGPKMYFYEERDRLWYAGGKLNMYIRHKTEGLNKVDSDQYNSIKRTDYIAGACMLVRKDVFNAIGLLPREYFLGWEDIDFCVAARNKGYECIFVPTALIWHKASASFRRQGLGHKQVFFGFRNRIMMRYKFLSGPKFFLFLLAQFFLVMPLHVVYYLAVYKDTMRVKAMFKGVASGIQDMSHRRVLYNPPGSNTS
jgi:GT2 family glycosyltransferase